MKVVNQSVDYVDHMGSDLSIVNAARVSFNKTVHSLTDKDEGLLKYLAKHNHWTPYAHTSISLRVKAPIFVARQLVKHQVGLVWNEVSRRYVDDEPEFYFPTNWRGRPVNAKQGSSDNIADKFESLQAKSLCEDALGVYNDLLKTVAPEQARMVLPQNTMTEWIWTGSVAAFHRVCSLRLDAHAQQETQEVAKMISDIVERKFPKSWEALNAK